MTKVINTIIVHQFSIGSGAIRAGMGEKHSNYGAKEKYRSFRFIQRKLLLPKKTSWLLIITLHW
jgi:hypothetical protein